VQSGLARRCARPNDTATEHPALRLAAAEGGPMWFYLYQGGWWEVAPQVLLVRMRADTSLQSLTLRLPGCAATRPSFVLREKLADGALNACTMVAGGVASADKTCTSVRVMCVSSLPQERRRSHRDTNENHRRLL
jgi:hypothetical protein